MNFQIVSYKVIQKKSNAFIYYTTVFIFSINIENTIELVL